VFRVVIPARHGSTRLPGKPLRLLGGAPLVLHVHRIAERAGAAEVVIATDDERIRAACVAAGAAVEMTAVHHASGTDRIAEVAARRGWAGGDIVVNVQGDEPLLPPSLIGQAARLLADTPAAAIATLAAPIVNESEYLDPNVVKVVARPDGLALYFSRAPIPWNRDGAEVAGAARHTGARRHIGLYAYRVSALRQLAAAPAAALELRERLEQLRALSIGLSVVVADAVERPGPGVDTPEDLERVAALLARGGHS